MIEARRVTEPFEQTMAKNGEWMPLLELVDPEGEALVLITGGFRNDMEKHHLLVASGTLAGAVEADMIRFVSDTWYSEAADGEELTVRPSEDPGAREALMVTEVKRTGFEVMTIPYSRGDQGEIIWDEPLDLAAMGDRFESHLADTLRFGLSMTAPGKDTALEMLKSLTRQHHTVLIHNTLKELIGGEEVN
jgi:hypothetical protein